MGIPEIVEFGRNFSAMIRIQGPDPKGLKMRKHAFHHYISGKTTLSASGIILPSAFNVVASSSHQVSSEPMSLVLTVASIIEPFLSAKHKDHMSEIYQVKPELISGAKIDVMIEGNARATDSEALHWLPAELITLLDIPDSLVALRSLIGASSGSLENSWEIGWSLASYNDDQPAYVDDKQNEVPRSTVKSHGEQLIDSSLMGNSVTRIAILKLPSRTLEDWPNLKKSSINKRGDLLVAMGAPFGVLSPAHFCNSISVGYVSNCYPPSSSHASLLMADIRCLPGMEGSPVFGEQSEMVGMLTRPLRQKGTGAEVQLVIPWEAILNACAGFQLPNTYNTKDCNSNSYITPPNPVEKAMSSICLITVGDGVWASGVLLNNHGLILTNAHLLEPWRFKKTTANENHKIMSNIFFTPSNDTKPMTFLSSFNKRNHQNIRVRVDYLNRWIWCDASVLYVSKGPLDIAVLQLEHVPDKLLPIVMDVSCPSPGSKVYVVGHGLFGPRTDCLPSACLGVVSKVVKAQRTVGETGQRDFPAMIETTAAVHPGGSGGAILNSNGHMISLVTSNARHGGGTAIPYLNFSIPCAALKPVLDFSKDMKDLSILEDIERPNNHLSSVWALMPPVSPKPKPEVDNIKDTKGSRFAKFIAELKQTSPLDKTDLESSKKFPSKL
uniref:glyoxysomal processing protease, glyoxysomal isoform X2 n=1 Tax=Erigeron canadensis TaxID=72917 RepID=UPI001CB8AEE9|nr:glyoxysomal processing protease, glyoxysomal isoform X2 [Erigeron canadensis]